jgi:hypothetical protein
LFSLTGKGIINTPHHPPSYFNHQLKESLMYMSGVGSLICLGAGFPNPTYAAMTSTLSLSGVAGYYAVWNIRPGDHLRH